MGTNQRDVWDHMKNFRVKTAFNADDRTLVVAITAPQALMDQLKEVEGAIISAIGEVRKETGCLTCVFQVDVGRSGTYLIQCGGVTEKYIREWLA